MSIFDLFAQISKETPHAGPIQRLVVGLGNPGLEYARTRHNAGFLAVDTLAKQANASLQQMKFRADCGEAMLGGVRCLLMKPVTYMNNSGEAVAAAAEFYKLKPEQVLVLYDDISLPPGKLRIRRKGSAGGHNGIKSIIALLGSDEFPRIKIGVGAKPNPAYDLADWVLSKFQEAEWKEMEQAFAHAADAATLIVQDQMDRAMNLYSK